MIVYVVTKFSSEEFADDFVGLEVWETEEGAACAMAEFLAGIDVEGCEDDGNMDGYMPDMMNAVRDEDRSLFVSNDETRSVQVHKEGVRK